MSASEQGRGIGAGAARDDYTKRERAELIAAALGLPAPAWTKAVLHIMGEAKINAMIAGKRYPPKTLTEDEN